MIGSHDSYTFEKPILSIHKATEKLWKTQCKTIQEQYDYGVRMFDIRVARTLNGKWVACHGVVDFHKHWDSLHDICEDYKQHYPEAIYRIVLERGTKYAEKKFKKQAKGLCEQYPNLWRIDIKRTGNWLGSVANNNQKLYDAGYAFALGNTWDPPAYEIHGTFTFKNLFKTNLKKSAMEINQAQVFKAELTDPVPAEPGIFRAKTASATKNNDWTRVVDPYASVKNTKSNLYFIDYCTNQYD